MLGFFVVGVYGGFIQAGVGFVVLAVTSYAGLDLLRGNAAKLLSRPVDHHPVAGGVRDVVAGGLAARPRAERRARWPVRFYGVHLAVFKGQAWLQRVVTATVILFAVLLWFQ